MSRVRLYSDDKQQFVRDIVNRLSELKQFTQSEKLSDITHSYYLGLDKEDMNFIKAINQDPLIKFEELEIYNVSAYNTGLAPSAHFAYLNISLGASSIDLIRSLKTLELFKKQQKPKKPEITIFIGIVALLAGGVIFLTVQITSVSRDLDRLKNDIAAVADKSDEIDEIIAKTIAYSGIERQLYMKNEVESGITVISNELLDLIFTTHSDRVIVSSIAFNESGGTLRVAARSVTEFDSSNYVEELKLSYLVESVLYTGYSYSSAADGMVYNFNIDVIIAVPEIEIAEDEETEVND
jgi:Tfp pilus assembly protein PilN